MFGNKAYRILLTTLLLAAAGCARIETNSLSDKPMTFRTYTSHSTKAGAAEPGVVSGNSLPEDTSFGVFAFYQPGVIGSSTGVWGNGGSRSSWKPDYMFNEKVDFDGTDYDYSPLRYWPANEENTISFWAFWPYELYDAANNGGALKFYDAANTSNAYSANSTGLPIVKYSVSADLSEQYDLLFDAFDNYDRFYDKYGDGTSCTPGMVPLRFRHVLSQVEFRIIADGESLPENATIRITDFELTNIYTDGTCANPAASFTDPGDAAGYWNVNTAIPPVDVTLSTSSTSTSLLLMPQVLAEDTSDAATKHSLVKLTMTYDIVFPAAHKPNDPSENITYANNKVTDAYLWKKKRDGHDEDIAYGVERWLPGRKYVYQIEVGLEEIEFSEVTEISWNTEWTYSENNN